MPSYEHRGSTPRIDPTASIAPSAVISGAVTIGPGARVLHGAVVSAEDGEVTIGTNTVVMEHALIRGRAGHPARIGNAVLIGPNAHVNGAEIGDGAFIATGAAIFPGAVIGAAAEVRIHGVVQVNTTVGDGVIVPIGWVAVGSPATILPPERHEEIWATQRELDFPGTVYGVPRGTPMAELMRRQSDFYAAHDDDRLVEPVVAEPDQA